MNIPDKILNEIILQKIILLRNTNGWSDIHFHINNLYLVLRLTINQYPYEMEYNKVIRSTIPNKPNQIIKRNRYIWSCIEKKIPFNENQYKW